MSSLLATLLNRSASFDSDKEEHHHSEGVQVERTWPATALALRRETRVREAKMSPEMQELALHALFRALLSTIPHSSKQHSGSTTLVYQPDVLSSDEIQAVQAASSHELTSAYLPQWSTLYNPSRRDRKRPCQ